ncbi:MAG TPA: HAMP domain-containing sensor histidine kinase [Gemmataceae bacterium]|jgi:two-component sensor histidine kinase
MATLLSKKEGMPKSGELNAVGNLGHVYLDVRRRQLHCLNARARQLRDEGVPFTADDLARHPLRTESGDLVAAADLPLIRAWRENGACEATFLFPEAAGPYQRVTWSVSPIPDLNGDVAAVVGTVLAGVPEPDWQTLAGLAHDLRTPLQALKLLLTLMGRSSSRPEEAKEVHDRIQASAGRALDIGMELLEWCRGSVRRDTNQISWFRLEPFLEELAAEQRVAAQQKALNLLTNLDATRGLEVHIDRRRLGRLLSNLLSNAVRYTEAGQVEFSAAWQNSVGDSLAPIALPIGQAVESVRVLVLSVIDTGTGITTEEQESIFHPFERGRAGKEGDSGGSGLGLAIVDRLVEELGLSLEVYSEYGRGSAFHLSLPSSALRTRHRASEQ